MAKITTFIIGIIIATLILSIFAGFTLEGATKYNLNADQINLSKYETYFNATQNNLENVKNDTESLQVGEDKQDILGQFFGSGYQALKTSKDSFTIFNDMSQNALEDANIPYARLFTAALISIVVVLIFIGVLIRAIIKVDI